MTLDKNIRKVKENVWKLDEGGAAYSLKRYSSQATARKVRHIHQELQYMQFPHIVPMLSTGDPLLIMQPWITGTKAVNFKKRIDRTDSLLALQALHNTKQQIDWEASPYLYYYPLMNKWEERLERFIENRRAIEKFIEKTFVDDVILFGKEAFSALKKKKWDCAEQTLLHGDVVHHNIFRDQNGLIRFIDFDLSCIGPAHLELALWTHRVLPHIGYHVSFLFAEQPILQQMDDAAKTMLLYPNEILREWLHLLSLPSQNQEKLADRLAPFTVEALSSWPKLWYDIERSMN
ncbi:phosphotransferase [Sporosarcina contaminans]|uniref:Phosphotransferase n=1 Tax=Sporosarcina contaminans TaxID=633403 RepID=A0ABW3U4I0_9BACL